MWSLLGPLLGQLLGQGGAIAVAVDRLVPDRNAAEKLKNEIALEVNQAAMRGDLAQIDVNAKEAGSLNLFVAGWRPAIGWVCALALFYQFFLAPMAVWAAGMFHVALSTPPRLDDVLWQLMFGMLGMGALRTVEKLKGVA